VKRFAQDDGFVGGLEIQLVGYGENTKRPKKSQALRMTVLREFLTKNIRLTLMELASWAKFSKFTRPCGTEHIL